VKNKLLKNRIFSFIKYTLFFLFGVLLLAYLIVQIGNAEIKNSPFHENTLQLIKNKKESEPKFLSLSEDLKKRFSELDISDKEKIKVEMISFFSYTESLKLGLFKIGRDLAGANYFWVGISLIAALISHWYRALRWNLLINTLGYKPRAIITFYSVLIGYLANVAVPRLGEVTRCAVLSKSEKIPTDKLIGTVLLERGIDLLSLLALIIIAFVLQIDVLSGFFIEVFNKEGESSFSYMVVLKMIGVLLLILAVIYVLFRVAFKLIKLTPWHFKLMRIFVGFISGIKTIKQLKEVRLFIIYSFTIWVGYFLMVYLCFAAYEPMLGLIKRPLVGLSTLVIGSLGMVAPVQGGIGAYHFCVQVCLELYGFAKEVALSFAFIVHTAQTLLVIVAGAASLILLPITLKRLKKHE